MPTSVLFRPMLLELGPVEPADVQQWVRFARRMVCELRLDPADLTGVATPDFLDECTRLMGSWEQTIVLEGASFRWSEPLDCEFAEYLLHGLVRCLRSPGLAERATHQELIANEPFSMHVVQALVDGLAAEGSGPEHLCDQVRASLGALLVH